MNTLVMYRKAVSLCLIALALAILAPSFALTSQASTAATVVNVTQNKALDFTLINGTGYDIKKVYIGPTDNPKWTDDMEVLRGRGFKNEATLDITFNPKTTAAKWDLRVEWADGDKPVNWYGIDLTEIETLTLLYNADTGKSSIRRN